MQTLLLIFSNLSIFLEDFSNFLRRFSIIYLFVLLNLFFYFFICLPHSFFLISLFFFPLYSATSHILKQRRHYHSLSWIIRVPKVYKTMYLEPPWQNRCDSRDKYSARKVRFAMCLRFGPKTPGVVSDIFVFLLQSAQTPPQNIS